MSADSGAVATWSTFWPDLIILVTQEQFPQDFRLWWSPWIVPEITSWTLVWCIFRCVLFTISARSYIWVLEFRHNQPYYSERANCTLQWRHNELDCVSNHRHLDCLLNHLFRRRSKKTSNLRLTGLCEGNSPVNSPQKGLVMRKCFLLMTSSWNGLQSTIFEGARDLL